MRRCGFTLVELLVVIAIISLLLTVSVQGLRAVREQGRATVCAANIRQLQTDLLAYEASHDRFPPGFELPGQTSGRKGRNAGGAGHLDPGGWWWFDYIHEFNHSIRNDYEMLTCPSRRQNHRWLDLNVLCGNYGVNLSIFRPNGYYLSAYQPFLGLSLSSSDIPRPSQTVLLTDSGYSLISWWHVTEEPLPELPLLDSEDEMVCGSAQNAAYVPGMSLNRNKTVCRGQADDAIGGRHPHKTVNVGFVDGSVAVKKPADSLVVEKTDDGQWDNSPVWLPKPDPQPVVVVTSPSPTP